MELICPNCRTNFTEKKHQRKSTGLKFCSAKCYFESDAKKEYGRIAIAPMIAKIKGKLPPHKGICGNCQKEFYAKYKDKKFCSLKCYVTSDECKKRLQENSIKVAARTRAGFGNPKERLKKPCLQCGEMFFCKPKTYDKQKYCSSTCYRLFMADRFDRWIANPESIALPQNYDEFLIQDELPCLVDNCGWSGKKLGNHLNLAHGITANDFKALAGFNKTTGLCTSEISLEISQRVKGYIRQMIADGRIHLFDSENRPKKTNRPQSLEGKEHKAKSTAINKLVAKPKFSRCLECGVKFPMPYSAPKKFCSIPCRSKNSYNRYKFEMVCGHCGNEFIGNSIQQRRVNKRLEVFCSISCRQARNISLTPNHQKHLERVNQNLIDNKT